MQSPPSYHLEQHGSSVWAVHVRFSSRRIDEELVPPEKPVGRSPLSLDTSEPGARQFTHHAGSTSMALEFGKAGDNAIERKDETN